MKDKNLPNEYNSLSLEELTNKASKMIKPEFDADKDGKMTPQELANGFGRK